MKSSRRDDALAEHRAAIFGVAYRMLGSAAEAEDVVQDACARFSSLDDPASIVSPRAWLTTVTTRLCIDRARSARARRETYVGPWLPEPIVAQAPEDAATAAPRDLESISFAFLVLLESLSPLERAAFLLHEVFDYTHAEVARTLERDEAACRKLVERARAHVREKRPRFAPTREAHRKVVEAFLGALDSGELGSLETLLAHDVVASADGGGRVHAARRPIVGRDAVIRYLRGLLRSRRDGDRLELVDVNGLTGLRAWRGDVTVFVMAIECDADAIASLSLVVNPEKLGPRGNH